ncbi:MAG TPA: (d)CMP kinase, partial [Caulobacteraceae bacterium]
MALVVAIDGPAASGKGTLARRLGAAFGLPVLDTGLLYRAVAAAVTRAGANLDDEAASAAAAGDLDLAALDEAALRSAAMG